MISILESHRLEERVSISRVECNSCNTTHAKLPDNLIPYSPYTLLFIVRVLKAYLNRKVTVENLCDRYQISISTLYRWKARFRQHTNLLLKAFRQLSDVTIKALSYIGSIPHLPSSFFERFGFSFLENNKRHTPGSGCG
jgi:hypothetical protein